MIKHLALIMDGNRRWARERGLPCFMGHKEGATIVDHMISYCLEKEITHLSLYAFSIENLKRAEDEKAYLFDLLVSYAQHYLASFVKKGVCIRFVGDRSLFPASVRDVCDHAEAQVVQVEKLRLNFLFCYGGQQEIVAGVKTCMHMVREGTLRDADMTVEKFHSLLWSGQSPAPEIIVRTGGVSRLSNFLLFSCAYSELFFTKTLWPDFSVEELEHIIQQYDDIKRNFGA